MPVFLNPESKVGLLQQSMKVESRHPVASICFPKVLFANRSFVSLACSHSVYRFSMFPGQLSAKFCFQDHASRKTKLFELTLNQAYEWIRFLNPPFFEVSPEGEDVSDYLCLMSYAKGKIGFDAPYAGDTFLGLIKCFWFQMNELICDAELLEGRGIVALPSKKFDLVGISGISSIDTLRRALGLKATRLILDINTPIAFSKKIRVPIDEWSVNNTTEQCEVHLWDDRSPVLGIVGMIAKVCPSLKRLTAFCNFTKQDGQPTIESAIGYLENINVLIDRMIGELKKVPANCTINILLDLYSWNDSKNKYPRDCLTTFRRHIRSGPVEEKNERFPNEQIRTEFITKHTDQRVSIDCKIITIYKCLEDGDIDMNGEDDNSDTGFTAEESDRDDDMV